MYVTDVGLALATDLGLHFQSLYISRLMSDIQA